MKNKITGFYQLAYQWVLDYTPRIILAIILFFVGRWLIKLFTKWMRRTLRAPRFQGIRPFMEGLVTVALNVLLLLTLMEILGIHITIFAAVITSFGVAAGFALSGTLQNFASGILILLLRPYSIGDNIITQGQEGTVTSVQLFYTIVTSFDNKTIVVPNSKLSNEVIINLSRQKNRRIDIELKLSYAIDSTQIKKIIEEIILKSQDLLTVPEHRITISALESDGYRLFINVWTKAHGFNDAKFSLQERIMNAIKENNIKLPGM